jgi:tRNA1Val (adenine37-N6)-methyltransferase
MEFFAFRNFKVWQSTEVFKLGTDTLILGALGSRFSAKNVLEIGAGTGAISLMYADKNAHAIVTAVEIQEASFRICTRNFSESPFANRMIAVHSSIQDYHPETPFDLILCNPPYFKNVLPSENDVKRTARHQIGLDFRVLLKKCAKLMIENAQALFIVPFNAYRDLKHVGLRNGLFVMEYWEILYKESDPAPQSVVVRMSKHEAGVPYRNVLRVRSANNAYHSDYVNLLKGFLPEQHFQ